MKQQKTRLVTKTQEFETRQSSVASTENFVSQSEKVQIACLIVEFSQADEDVA